VYPRLIEEKLTKTSKSILLLGPRQTGKSTLIKGLAPDISINLAFEQVFLEYSAQPDLLEKVLQRERSRTVFIDEVQRIPSLLNTVQGILDDNPNKYRFYLTGSSARKLRRGRANLLPGRVVQYQLGPLIWEELGNDLDLDDAIAFGTLPGIVSERDTSIRQDLLRTYASTYLKEASKSGEFLDFSKMGSLAGVTQKTSSRFFEILEDTLIVNRLDAYAVNETRRLIRHPKFYFFDNGVLNGLLKNFTLSQDRRGFLFEHFIVNQILTANSILGEPARLSTYRTDAGSEVDLIVEKNNEVLALEIKSGARLTIADFSGLKSFSSLRRRGGTRRLVLLYGGSRAYNEDAVEVLPWRQGLAETLAFLQ
jgi:predicted AAA+ superfamily ATPase